MSDIAQTMYPNGPSNSLGNDPVGDENYRAALNTMNLTPQEQSLYKMHLDNLTGPGGVDNADGSRSSLFVRTFGIGDKTYVIPTVSKGKILPPDEALALAKGKGIDKYPSYATEEEAQSRYSQMHTYMDKDTGKFLQSRH